MATENYNQFGMMESIDLRLEGTAREPAKPPERRRARQNGSPPLVPLPGGRGQADSTPTAARSQASALARRPCTYRCPALAPSATAQARRPRRHRLVIHSPDSGKQKI